jgi:cystathionine beta-synthase
MSRRLTREEGLFVGGSSGLIAKVALDLARRIDDPDAFVVTFLCDTGERYLSKLYSDEWMRENQMLEAEHVTLGDMLSRKDANAPAIVSVAPAAGVRQALNLMALHDVSQLPVMDGDECVGSVVEATLSQRGLETPALLEATVREVMDAPFPSLTSDEAIEFAVKLLSKSTPAVLVLEHGHVEGIVTRSDMLRFMMGR